jgi:hypothetical protein
MSEEIFLQKNSVTVTKSRLIVPGETYAINGIISVKRTSERVPSTKNREASFFEKIPTIGRVFISLSIVAALFHLFHHDFVSFIIIASMLLFVYLYIKRPLLVTEPTEAHKYSITLRTSSGEVKVLEELDLSFMNEVTNALNKAIIARG